MFALPQPQHLWLLRLVSFWLYGKGSTSFLISLHYALQTLEQVRTHLVSAIVLPSSVVSNSSTGQQRLMSASAELGSFGERGNLY